VESPLQDLIEFAMANAWILVIIIGFVFNTFRRFNSGEKEPTSPVPMPKQFNPFDQERKLEKDEYQVETKYETELEPEEIPKTQVPNTFYDRYRELQQQGMYTETVTEEEEPVPTVIKPTVSGETRPSKTYSKNKVVEGIIWSEILGPPRAKKPYQIRR
jgi:hypothetical protein